jgi:ABC-type glycerol-3-phosphate transport system permease component
MGPRRRQAGALPMFRVEIVNGHWIGSTTRQNPLAVSRGEIMAYCSMIKLPVLIMFVALQRAFVSSIASAGMKN